LAHDGKPTLDSASAASDDAAPTMPAVTRILIVEDDLAIREGLELNLQLDGHATVCAADGERALDCFERTPPDLVVLDVMLPGRNGFEVLRTIRARRKDVPVILLTARADEADKVLGLELGADDYVTKPFGLGELRARIRAALRRANLQAQPQTATFADVEVDRAGHRVRKAGVEVPLTAREFSLIVHFLDNRERVLTRGALLRKVWGLEHATERTVDNFVMRLRGKFEPDPDAPKHFVTVRGVGYRFSPTGNGE
jgi:DNA-binding response OmpR family regulator